MLAIVYRRAEPLLDVNMARVLGRFLGSFEGAEAKPTRTLHEFALRLVRGKQSLDVNWAVLDARSTRLSRKAPAMSRVHAAGEMCLGQIAPIYSQRTCSLRLTIRGRAWASFLDYRGSSFPHLF